MKLTERQRNIIDLVKKEGPITGSEIATYCHVTRAALRGDFEVLTSLKYLGAKRKLGYYYRGEQDNEESRLKQINVKSYTSQPVIALKNSTAYDAAVLLFTEDVGTIFIAEDDELLGIVSRKDLLKAAMGNQDLHEIPISVVMTPKSKIVYVLEEESIVNAAQKIMDYEVDSLPVLYYDKNHVLKIRGRITKTNFIQLILDLGLNNRS